jgi:hypothetical protein
VVSAMGQQPPAPYAFGQLFSKDTQAIFYNFKLNPIQVGDLAAPNDYWMLGMIAATCARFLHPPDYLCAVQRMLDFDFVCGTCNIISTLYLCSWFTQLDFAT